MLKLSVSLPILEVF